jgi:hypothetical protein
MYCRRLLIAGRAESLKDIFPDHHPAMCLSNFVVILDLIPIPPNLTRENEVDNRKSNLDTQGELNHILGGDKGGSPYDILVGGPAADGVGYVVRNTRTTNG